MARDFDGANDYLGPLTILSTSYDPITISLLCTRDVTSNNREMISVYADATNRMHIRGHGSGGVRFHITGTSAENMGVVSGMTIGSNVWNHCCLTNSGSSMKGYVNFTNTGTLTHSQTPSNFTSVVIGGNEAPAGEHEGYLAEVAIWSAQLVDAEVSALNDGYSPLLVRPSSLVAYLPIVGRYDPEICLITGNTAALTSAPPQAAHPRVIYPSQMSRSAAVGAAAPPVTGTGPSLALTGVGY